MKSSQLRYLQPEYRLPVDKEEVDGVLRSELADWLALQWFYPSGFSLQSLSESPSHFCASGQQLEYIFPKAKQLGQDYSFAKRCEQMLDFAQKAKLLAADSVLGLRFLKWTFGELTWLEGLHDVDSTQKVPQADEVALVLRRVPESARLSNILLDEGELSVEQLDQLIARIVRFHQAIILRDEREYSSSYVSETVFEPLREFCAEFENYLDLFSRFALKEIGKYLNSFFASNELLFRARSQAGFVAETHGKLRASQIIVSALLEDSEELNILGRNGQLQDVLADLASLYVDLELYEAKYVADELLVRYRERLPEHFDSELFKFYRVTQGLASAIEVFSDTGADRSVRANKALGRALRTSVNFPKEAVLIVCGSAVGEAQSLAEALAELFDLAYLSVDDVKDGISSSLLSEQALFDRFSQWADRLLKEDGCLVTQWLGKDNQLSEQVYQQLRHWAASKNIPYRIIRCDELDLLDERENQLAAPKNSQLSLALEIASSMAVDD